MTKPIEYYLVIVLIALACISPIVEVLLATP